MLDRSEVGKRGYLDRDFRLVHLKDSLAQKIDYHYHEFDKLVIFLGGKVTYVVEGVTYFLKPWDIVLIQHNLIHRPIIHAEEPYERAVLWLGRDWIAQRSDPGEPLDACLDKSREQGFHLLRTGEEGRLGYARFIQQLEEALRSEEFGARRMADTLCQQLLIQVNRDFLRANTAPAETDSYHLDPKMEEILRISDDVTIMRDGTWVATKPASELTMNEIIKLMVGRELTNRYPPKDNVIGDVLFEAEGLSSVYENLKDASFKAHKGEILGVAGLDGSGRTELLENIFGLATRHGGTMTLNGKRIRNRNPRESIKNGFAMLTEERRATGIFGILNIRENTTISSLKKCRTGPFLSKAKMKKNTDWCINAMRVKTPDQETKIRSLSGGNQQKVILGRWLLTDPTVLLLDEPTRGIDVGAKYEIYQLIINLAKEGKTVIMVSSEMPELLGVCDRILVMSGGRLAGEVDAKTTSQEEIMTLAAKFA